MSERQKHGAYSPGELEAKWYRYWEEKKFFHAKPDERPGYSIVIPPPNVTGALHMGHALNNVIQDVLIRRHRMCGYNACWLPGTDHAGIATQTVVETRLRKEEGKTRHDVGRKALLERIWQWKETYGNRIIEQLKRLGCSCDWDRTCFTMDEKLSYAVRYVFLELFQEGLIYRGKRLINWCPGCRTALSNDELVHKDVSGNLWEIRYPVKGKKNVFVTVATTRPETMLGDTAVAVHSQDARYESLVGKTCILPLVEREIPIIADDILADPKKGTGAVKVTPAHDPNDYQCGRRNDLLFVNILEDDGTLNENAGKYRGMSVVDARKKVLADLNERALLGKKESIEHNVAHCYRSDDVVEPYLSNQWFVKMEPLVNLARKAVTDGEVVFFPAKRKDDYLRWLDQTPDWCISRQIWWGHRIPIWYCLTCHPDIEIKNGEPVSIPETVKPILPKKPREDVKKCPDCGSEKLVQDPDVLDTWFSSQLWPLSTFGWPEDTEELRCYYPTDVLVTARDIIALWVARMVMMGMKFKGEKPFSHVFINPTIQDEHGDIMSKSRGNGVDPLKLIEGGSDHILGKQSLGNIPKERDEYYLAYGCDAMRYSMMSLLSSQLQDVRLNIIRDKRKEGGYNVQIPLFEEGRRFCNKIWQACHGVIFANCQDAKLIKKESSHIEDLWLSHRLNQVIVQLEGMYAGYRFGEMCETLYHFFWDDLCSWYLEIVKPRLWEEHGKRSKQYAQTCLLRALDTFLRLLHPIMPYISEELWQTLRGLLTRAGADELPNACIVADWPNPDAYPPAPKAHQTVELAREVASALNNIRAEQKGIQEGKKIPHAILVSGNSRALESLHPLFSGIKKIARTESIETQEKDEKPQCSAMRIVGNIKIYVPLEGLIDMDAERDKLDREIAKLQEQTAKIKGKLSNEKYTTRAPAQVVQKDRDRLADCLLRLETLERELKDIGKD